MVDTSKWSILVVEDNADSSRLISKILQYHGSEVHLAHSGEECLERLKELNPTIVLLDLSLPKIDGWETLNQIRADAKTAKIPVVALTAYHSVSVAEDARVAGFDAYFSKPINTKTIVPELANLLDTLNSD